MGCNIFLFDGIGNWDGFVNILGQVGGFDYGFLGQDVMFWLSFVGGILMQCCDNVWCIGLVDVVERNGIVWFELVLCFKYVLILVVEKCIVDLLILDQIESLQVLIVVCCRICVWLVME